MNKFSGSRVLLGCSLFIFIVMGGSGIHSSGYSLLPETFSVSITMLGTYGMTLSIAGIISSLMLTSVKKKIGLKGLLYYNAIIQFIVALCAKFLGGSLITLFVFLISIGTTLYAGAHAVQSEIISNWYVKNRGQKISVIMGSALLGLAFYQFIGGQLFSRMGQLDVWFVVYLVNGIAMILIAKFLIVAERPDLVGQKAYGSDEAPAVAPQAKKATIKTTRNQDNGDSRPSIYSNPSLWLCVIGRLGLCGGVNYITTYATMYFTGGGVSLSTASIILTFCTLSATVFSFLNGQFLSTLKTRGYIFFLLAGAILANVGMIVYSSIPSFFFIILIVLFYGIGYSGSHCMNLVAGIMFDPEDAANANSKIYGFGATGGLVMQPLNAFMVENFGYNTMFFVIAILAVISLVAFQTALSLAQKQGKTI